MTKKRIDGGSDGDGAPKPAAGKKMHLHEIRSTAAHDGTFTHHHTYKKSKDDQFPLPERGPVATSANADEAGQHVAEQFGMNGGDAAAPAPQATAAPAAAAPAAEPAPQE